MKGLVDIKNVEQQLNKCYQAYDPSWQKSIFQEGENPSINGFKYHLEMTAGLRLDCEIKVVNGKYGYKVNKTEIIDEELFTLWMLRWS